MQVEEALKESRPLPVGPSSKGDYVGLIPFHLFIGLIIHCSTCFIKAASVLIANIFIVQFRAQEPLRKLLKMLLWWIRYLS